MRKFVATLALAVFAAGAAHAADLGGKLFKVGSDTTSPPMESVDPASGQIVGFDVDVVNAICAKINCQAEFVTTGWDGIFVALDQGDFDLVASGAPLLAPGVGAQGAGPAELEKVFGRARRQVLASTSRGVLGAGPEVVALRRAARDAAEQVTTALRR